MVIEIYIFCTPRDNPASEGATEKKTFLNILLSNILLFKDTLLNKPPEKTTLLSLVSFLKVLRSLKIYLKQCSLPLELYLEVNIFCRFENICIT